MGETVIPTFSLRYVWKFIPRPEFGEHISQKEKVLQQRFERPNGASVWRDVELIDDEENPLCADCGVHIGREGCACLELNTHLMEPDK